MALRCLLFSSNEEIVQPIWQVLAELGIEGEYCKSAVDAVERVTTQLFQIVITDWEDQPEAAFLLKTARDLKAAQRPLTLAIVGDDARLPEALRAGANSVLVKPIRAEQVRDTMSTACELLRAKLQPAVPQTATPLSQPGVPEGVALAAAAAAGAASPPASVSLPASVTKAPEKTFRAGEFLQSPGSAPGGQFDTEEECEVQKSLEQAAVDEVDALTELEPMASAVQNAPVEPAARAEAETPLSGWAALQARLTKSAPPPAAEPSPAGELLSYGDTPSYGGTAEPQKQEDTNSAKKDWQPRATPECAASGYMPVEAEEVMEPVEAPGSNRGKILAMAALAVLAVVLAAVPRTRQSLRILSRNAVRAGQNWLNPPPAPLPQPVPLHDSFGQAGDEYKLPAPANIPDATTDASQIRVVPVVDPGAKPDKTSETNGTQGQAPTGEANPPDPNQVQPSQNGQAQGVATAAKDATSTNVAEVPASPVVAPPASASSGPQAPASTAVGEASAPTPRVVAPPAQRPDPAHVVSVASNAGIPSSLKSQMASMTPDASGNKPVEAAMSSIEPVNLPEAAARELLSQNVDPAYPAAAKASGQGGSVVLQVVIGRDGTVQDAKFLQGSLIFARPAIDAVKQWHFKPYSMNGRPVSVQSVITLNFKPPA